MISLTVAVCCAALGFGLYHFQTRHASTVLIDRANALAEEEKWHPAASYLYRYLAIAPDDDDIRVQMTDYYVRSAQTPAGMSRAAAVIYQTLGRLPENDGRRIELQRSLTRLLFEQGNFRAAQDEAHELLEQDENDGFALRTWALSYSARAQMDSTVSLGEAQQALERAIAELPHDVELAAAVSDFYVRNAEKPDVLQTQAEPLARADDIMDALVASTPQVSESWLARYRHRQRRGLSNGLADLEKALEVDPNNKDALFQRALARVQENTPDSITAAADDLRRILEQDEQFAPAYMALGHLHLQRQDTARAIRAYEKGRSFEGDDALELGVRLGDALLLAGRLDDVETLLPELDAEFKATTGRLNADQRLYLDSNMKFLRAGFLVAKGQHDQAIPILRSAILATTPRSGQEWAKQLLVRAHTMIAEIWTRSDVPELAAESWAQVTALQPKTTVASFIAGQHFLRAGLFADAIPHFERYLEADGLGPEEQRDEALLGVLRAQLALQLKNAPAQRKWAEFERTLELARERLPNRWEIEISAIDQQLALESPEATNKARRQLAASENEFGDRPEFWRAATMAYRRLGLSEEADRALEQLERLQPSSPDATIFKCSVLARDGKYDEVDRILTESLSKAPDEEKPMIQMERIRFAFAANNLDLARKLLHELDVQGAVNAANDRRLLIMGAELALADDDYFTARKWEQRLEAQAGQYDFDVRFLKLRRLMAEYGDLNATQRGELSALVEQLRTERPRWYPVVAAAAQYAELTGDYEQAQRDYEIALQLGDRRLPILQRYAGLLYRFGRFADAERVLGYVPKGPATEENLDAMAVSIALRRQQLDNATEIAAEAAARHPDDPKRALWHANLLLLDGNTAEAEECFRELRRKYPRDLSVWGGWTNFLLKTDRRLEVVEHLETLAEDVDVEEPLAEFVKGQGFERLGDLEEARHHYENAVSLEPNNIDYRNRFAKLLLSIDVPAARAQLEETVRQAPQNNEARQRLAALLATSNSDADWAKIDKLLADFGGIPNAEDRRLRAVLLSRRGKDRPTREGNCRLAARIMSELINDSNQPVNNIDEILISGIYGQLYRFSGQIADLENARTHLQKLVNTPIPPDQYLIFYLEFLLRHAQLDETQGELSNDRKAMRESYLNEAKAQLDQLVSSAKDEHGNVPLPVFRLRLQLLEAQGRRAEIRQVVRDYADSLLPTLSTDAERARAYHGLGNLLSAFDYRTEAEQWYEKLAEITPQGNLLLATSLAARGQIQEAVELCLQTAGGKPNADVTTIIAQLFVAVDHSDRDFEQFAPLLNAALRENESHVDLLAAAAVLNAKRGNVSEALELFRKVIQLDHDNVMALNNAATLLGEQPGRHEQALEYVQRAIEIAGRRESLLDTQGTIHLWAGRGEEAVTSLEEAAAGIVSDPRIYLHLAGAYEIIGKADAARNSLQAAAEMRIDDQILTDRDRKLLDQLRTQFDDTAINN